MDCLRCQSNPSTNGFEASANRVARCYGAAADALNNGFEHVITCGLCSSSDAATYGLKAPDDSIANCCRTTVDTSAYGRQHIVAHSLGGNDNTSPYRLPASGQSIADCGDATTNRSATKADALTGGPNHVSSNATSDSEDTKPCDNWYCQQQPEETRNQMI
mmetsp:Transcript_48745/g.91267  ORF Transcript_48745/g.91267 Transcript_48745/m.91267 type:complete len:161 (+) Transcript_48745:556-1038(+)